MSDKIREEFEMHYSRPLSSAWNADKECYYCMNGSAKFKREIEIYNARWLAWKASRESLVVELPGMIGMNQPFTGTPISEIREHNQFNEAIGKCRKAIHAAGVRTK